MSVETLLKNSDLTQELLLQALLPLTSENGPLVLQEGQDFPHRGRSVGAGLSLCFWGLSGVGVTVGKKNGVPLTHSSVPPGGLTGSELQVCSGFVPLGASPAGRRCG